MLGIIFAPEHARRVKFSVRVSFPFKILYTQLVLIVKSDYKNIIFIDNSFFNLFVV